MKLRWIFITLGSVVLLPGVGQGETIRQSVHLPATGKPASQHNPPCTAAINPTQTAIRLVGLVGGGPHLAPLF